MHPDYQANLADDSVSIREILSALKAHRTVLFGLIAAGILISILITANFSQRYDIKQIFQPAGFYNNSAQWINIEDTNTTISYVTQILLPTFNKPEKKQQERITLSNVFTNGLNERIATTFITLEDTNLTKNQIDNALLNFKKITDAVTIKQQHLLMLEKNNAQKQLDALAKTQSEYMTYQHYLQAVNQHQTHNNAQNLTNALLSEHLLYTSVKIPLQEIKNEILQQQNLINTLTPSHVVLNASIMPIGMNKEKVLLLSLILTVILSVAATLVVALGFKNTP